ncbi:MAG: NYN domain-containing protein [Candidatus Omnitrophica bacterium]|nr:NYN domain-containing protein [Candidatus Omnitrophota bacterium]
MPLHYILDGFNVAKRRGFPKVNSALEDHKTRLVDFIINNNVCGSKRNRVTVVFDGNADPAFQERRGGIEVVFSGSSSADDKIRQIAGAGGKPRDIIVVSDDRELRASMKALGVCVMGSSDFIMKGQKKDISGRIPKAEIDSSQERRITEELRKVWLK